MYFVRRISLPGALPERVVAALVLACLLLCVSSEARAASGSYIDFGAYDTQRALAAGTERGITFKNGAARLARGRTKGTLTSRVYDSAHKDTFIPSWNARTPPGTWLQMEMRLRSGGSWTRWWDMGVWAKGADTIKRHSVNGQRAGDWRVQTETLQSIGPLYADAYQRLSVSPHPSFYGGVAHTEGQGDLRDSLQLLPQWGCSRRGEREPVGQRPICACPVADDVLERR